MSDKVLHFYAGAIISIVAGLFLNKVFPGMGALFGLIISVGIGAAKEVIYDDLLKKGTASIWDFISTAFGSFVGFIVLYIIFRT